ncbi:hypothetical protein D3C87_1766480 [compost metagenome]
MPNRPLPGTFWSRRVKAVARKERIRFRKEVGLSLPVRKPPAVAYFMNSVREILPLPVLPLLVLSALGNSLTRLK